MLYQIKSTHTHERGERERSPLVSLSLFLGDPLWMDLAAALVRCWPRNSTFFILFWSYYVTPHSRAAATNMTPLNDVMEPSRLTCLMVHNFCVCMHLFMCAAEIRLSGNRLARVTCVRKVQGEKRPQIALLNFSVWNFCWLKKCCVIFL